MLPSVINGEVEKIYYLKWRLSISRKYPLLFRFFTAGLSVFHGQNMKSKFSVYSVTTQ